MCPRSNFNNFPPFFIAFYSRLDLESHVRLEHADLAKKRIIRIGNFYRADTVLFLGAKNREIQKSEKMDLRHLIFLRYLKSVTFRGKPMPTRPHSVRGPEDCRLKLHVPWQFL